MKKILSVVFIIVFIFFSYSLKSSQDIPLTVMEKELLSNTELEKLTKCDEKDVLYHLNIDTNDYKEFLYYRSTEALAVNELFILKANDSVDLNHVQSILEKRVTTQKNIFESYGPSQIKQLESVIIKIKGNYIFFCVDDNPEPYVEVFKHVI